MNDRPDKATMLELLHMNGKSVTHTTVDLIEDVDGAPAGVLIDEQTGTMHIDLEALGWTKAELLDDTIQE